MKIICEEQKPVYCLNPTHLEILHYQSLSDKKFKCIVHLFSNILHLNLNLSIGFSDKILKRIAKSYSNLKYLNLRKRYDDRLITDKGLYAIANSCHKLEYLNISYHKEFSLFTVI
ncbi:hypothetical protein C1645_747052 [Glomus cerebriforme]|uniref:F-box domain-containing protein n=1 Tax=Glomus cerebriforme TaxID=658196 RepID=A0A397TSC2_9GLOM|nr:hypothetical protein C1645_747052 [Glomus cerebriforme]